MSERVDLSALDALAEAAMAGPWEAYQHRDTEAWSVAGDDTVCDLWRLVEEDHTALLLDNAEANAALIVALRNAWPAIKAEIEALRGALDAATDRDGEPLHGFVLDHHDYMALHCTLNDAVIGATS